MIRLAGRMTAVVVVMLAVAWGALALWFDGSTSRVLAGALAVGFAVICILPAGPASSPRTDCSTRSYNRRCILVDVNRAKQHAGLDSGRCTPGANNLRRFPSDNRERTQLRLSL